MLVSRLHQWTGEGIHPVQCTDVWNKDCNSYLRMFSRLVSSAQHKIKDTKNIKAWNSHVISEIGTTNSLDCKLSKWELLKWANHCSYMWVPLISNEMVVWYLWPNPSAHETSQDSELNRRDYSRKKVLKEELSETQQKKFPSWCKTKMGHFLGVCFRQEWEWSLRPRGYRTYDIRDKFLTQEVRVT